MMKVYLLVERSIICVQGYEVGFEDFVLGVYSTRKKAIEAMYRYDDDAYTEYLIAEKEVQ